MTITLGINGFGRIGRCTLAHIAESARNDVQVVKINATGPIETSAHLLRYDSVHGRFPGEVRVDGDTMDLGRGPMKVFSTYDPAELDWYGCDVVLECTGKFNDGAKSQGTPGARREEGADLGARQERATARWSTASTTAICCADDRMISNGSCTTNCLAPLAKVLDEAIGIERGIMTTIHSYTGDQPTLDRRHERSLPRARRGDGDDPDLDRRRQGAGRGAARNWRGKLDGTAHAGADAECLRRGSDLRGGPRRHASRR